MQLVIPIRAGREPLGRQIYAALRQRILDGVLAPGDRLPSTRDLGEQLGVSRTIVVAAYEQLLAEGFVVGRVGAGTFVTPGLAPVRPSGASTPARLRLSRFGAAAAAVKASVEFPAPNPAPLRYDFAYGRSDVDCFPFDHWWRLLHRCARRTAVRALDYGEAAGVATLREAICAHVRRSRAVVCEPSQVIVVNGSQQALDLVTRVLIEPGDRVVIEDPLYQGTREVLRVAGATVVAVPVDRDGLDPDALPRTARLAFVTPSHQYPSGAILPLARRQALLRWAARADAAIVEDDYDGEFRYGGKRLESLQGLDTAGRVIYVGTFSRTIFSSLRIGYLIVPPALREAFTAAKWLCDRHTATLEQETLAEFIRSGRYERHLRRLRRRNAIAREALLDAVHHHLGDRVTLTGDGAGAHVVLWLAADDEDRVIAAAAIERVAVYGVRPYFLRRPAPAGIILGYSRLGAADVREGIRRLARAWR
jgi:GntR family transcriptional regulator / MocR family aminotransferase